MNTRPRLVVLLLLLLSSSAFAQTNSTQIHVIVRRTDFDDSVTFEIVAAQDYPSLRKEVEQQNKTMEETFNDMRSAWKKRHDREITKTVHDENGKEKTYKVKAPSPPFPLLKPPERTIRPVTQFPTLEAAEAKKKELEEIEMAVESKTSSTPTDASKTLAGGRARSRMKRPDSSSRGRASDANRRPEDGYLPDDPTAEQLRAELMGKLADLQKAPDPAAKPNK